MYCYNKKELHLLGMGWRNRETAGGDSNGGELVWTCESDVAFGMVSYYDYNN